MEQIISKRVVFETMLQQPMATDDNRLSLVCMTHWYGNPMHCFFGRDTRITILEGACTGQKGWVDSIAFKKPTGFEERAFCYEATLESGKWINVRWDHVAPGWLSDEDLVWLLERLPQLTFSID